MEKDLKVGQVMEVENPTYGKYNTTCIAFIDLRFGKGTPRYEEMKSKRKEDIDSVIDEIINSSSKWNDKFHPKDFLVPIA